MNLTKFSISNYDIILLTSLLENFINNDIEEIPKNEKLEDNIIAKNLITRLNNKVSNFKFDEVRVLCNALLLFEQMSEHCTSPNSEENKYIKRASELLNTFYPLLESSYNY